MTGDSWHPGCPVGLGDLRLLMLTHWGFDGRPQDGTARSCIATSRTTVVSAFRAALCGALPDPPHDSGGRLRRRATTARSRPTTRRRSTAATSMGRRAGPSTRTGARSTSTRSRTRTSRAAGRPIARVAPTSTAARQPGRDGLRGWRARARVRRDRLGLGRPLVRRRRTTSTSRRAAAERYGSEAGAARRPRAADRASVRRRTRYAQIAPPSTPPASGPTM